MRTIRRAKPENDRLVGRILLGTALATLAGYAALAWSILRKDQRGERRR